MTQLDHTNILIQVPVYTFWKDLNFNYLGCNQALANLVGKQDPLELVGKSDYELWGDFCGDIYRESDQKVLDGELLNNVREPQMLPDHSRIMITINKKLLLDQLNNVVGIIGSYMESVDSVYFGKKDPNKKNIPISKKQGECLYYLAQGYSSKLIAQEMNLSTRTVEHYVETLKFKLQCENKYQLTLKAISLDFIRERLIRDGKW